MTARRRAVADVRTAARLSELGCSPKTGPRVIINRPVLLMATGALMIESLREKRSTVAKQIREQGSWLVLWAERADVNGTFGSATLRTLAALSLLASASCGSLVELWRLKLALESHFDESAVTVMLFEGGHMLVIFEDVARSNLSQHRRFALADSVARFVLARYGERRLTAVRVTFGQRESGR